MESPDVPLWDEIRTLGSGGNGWELEWSLPLEDGLGWGSSLGREVIFGRFGLFWHARGDILQVRLWCGSRISRWRRWSGGGWQHCCSSRGRVLGGWSMERSVASFRLQLYKGRRDGGRRQLQSTNAG